MEEVLKQIPFEIHLTVANLATHQVNPFISFCQTYSGKPILIELAQGNYIQQSMFSKVVQGNNLDDILPVAKLISQALTVAGFEIKRLKIEVPSKHSKLFRTKQLIDTYFEWHGKIEYKNTIVLANICNQHRVHLSKNALNNESGLRFITLREFGNKNEFDKRVKLLSKELLDKDYSLLKQESEFCIYDNNAYLDEGWLPQ